MDIMKHILLEDLARYINEEQLTLKIQELSEYLPKFYKLSENSQLFSVACYEKNSITELEDILKGDSEQKDIKKWGISSIEWRLGIKHAILIRLQKILDICQ